MHSVIKLCVSFSLLIPLLHSFLIHIYPPSLFASFISSFLVHSFIVTFLPLSSLLFSSGIICFFFLFLPPLFPSSTLPVYISSYCFPSFCCLRSPLILDHYSSFHLLSLIALIPPSTLLLPFLSFPTFFFFPTNSRLIYFFCSISYLCVFASLFLFLPISLSSILFLCRCFHVYPFILALLPPLCHFFFFI